MKVFFLLCISMLCSCSAQDYHLAVISQSMIGSTQDYHLAKLRSSSSQPEHGSQRVCPYYPAGYGAFSEPCYYALVN